MSHPDEGVLQELLDGELAPADAAAVRAHLAGCASVHRASAGPGGDAGGGAMPSWRGCRSTRRCVRPAHARGTAPPRSTCA